MRPPRFRFLAVALLAAGVLIGIQGTAPAAAEPTATLDTGDCVDGAQDAQVHLSASDSASSTFTTIVTRGEDEVFRDASHQVPAGTTDDVSIPGLTYGGYVVRVLVEGDTVLLRGIQVSCPPVSDYTNPMVQLFVGCKHDGVVTFTNRPIEGATGDLLPVSFVLFEDRATGTRTIASLKLPDGDADPYQEKLTFNAGEFPKKVHVTANGEKLAFTPGPVATCLDPPDVPNTGF